MQFKPNLCSSYVFQSSVNLSPVFSQETDFLFFLLHASIILTISRKENREIRYLARHICLYAGFRFSFTDLLGQICNLFYFLWAVTFMWWPWLGFINFVILVISIHVLSSFWQIGYFELFWWLIMKKWGFHASWIFLEHASIRYQAVLIIFGFNLAFSIYP